MNPENCCRSADETVVDQVCDYDNQRFNPALTQLIWEHVNPYGRFEIDMMTRLPLA